MLNSSYQPVQLVTWQKALILWLQDKVEVLEFHEQLVRSASESFHLPSVMRLKKYVRRKPIPRLRFSRENVYARDRYTCQYCARQFPSKELTLDHVVPASKFGRKDWTNVVTACRPCNHRKGNRTPIGAGMPLLNEPRIPLWLPVIEPIIEIEHVPEKWLPYLNTG
jgi:5-methylcytosine-specific restriction endonuclease McrA